MATYVRDSTKPQDVWVHLVGKSKHVDNILVPLDGVDGW
jgi:hypothetical protein